MPAELAGDSESCELFEYEASKCGIALLGGRVVTGCNRVLLRPKNHLKFMKISFQFQKFALSKPYPLCILKTLIGESLFEESHLKRLLLKRSPKEETNFWSSARRSCNLLLFKLPPHFSSETESV